MESSRIFVRGLPPNLTAEEFQRHFSRQAKITDARLLPHRRIGYIGFKCPEDAVNAVKYHNKSFIRTSRIGVELARSVEDQSALRSQNHSTNPGRGRTSIVSDHGSENRNLGKRKRADLEADNHKNTKLQEYLEVMQLPSKSRIWSNEDSIVTNAPSGRARSPPLPVIDKCKDDNDYKNAPKKPTKHCMTEEVGGDLLLNSKSSSTADVTINMNPIVIEELPVRAPPPPTDEDWLRSRTTRLLDLVDGDEALASTVERARDDENEAERAVISGSLMNKEVKDPSVQTDEEIKSGSSTCDTPLNPINDINNTSGRLFVRNLSYTATEDDLKKHLESNGHSSIIEVHVSKDSRSGKSKGFAYVQFVNQEEANAALDNLDGKAFQGRLLHIMPALMKKQTGLDEFAISKLPLKRQQHIKRKAEAASSTFNWNSLYMSADAVMSSMSARLGVSKSELLDPTSSNAAVKQALAETHIIQETKSYFIANGINLDAFKDGERGDTAILVKNFAYGTKSDELKMLFETYGNVLRVLMPPAGTISVVEFEKAEHARSAFKSLAYRKFKDSVLFLEKAPKSLLNSLKSQAAVEEVHAATSQGAKPLAQDLLEGDAMQQTVNTSTLFVRNLSFSSTNERLREVFEPLDGFMSAKIKMKPDPKKPGQYLSMGFGFLEFRSKEQAEVALAAMDGYKLDGHELLIRASHKAVDAAEAKRVEHEAKKMAGRKTKIIIKNLPFETSKRDIRALFGSYGQLRSVRLPKKFDSSARGFAFADFVTAREAENAMIALKDTHLLGRRLVLEFAADDALDPEKEIEKMQSKAGSQANMVALQKISALGRKKFSLETGEDLERD